MNEIELKEKLEIFAQDEFRPPEKNDLLGIIPEMLHHIGTTDSYLRDDLIYTTFGTWILEYNAIGQEQLHDLLHTIIGDQHIFYKIGEQNTDTVFRRSFSILLLPLLLIAHRSQPFLTPEEVKQVKEKLISYLRNEKDRRGFVEEKGWAHTIAHAADAIDDLAQCTELAESDLREILEVVHTVIGVQDTGYIHGEDERIATAVIAIINRSLLSDAELEQWIRSFSETVLAIQSMPEKLVIRTNVKSFLQSLYFRLQWEQMADQFSIPIVQTLREISLFANGYGD